MKHYLLAVHSVEGMATPPEEEIQQAYQDTAAFNSELTSAGAWVFGGGLLPPDTATVVRAQGGKVVTTDGPFAETKEQLGGLYVVECDNVDEAIEWAARIPAAERGTIEVRPLAQGPS